MKFFRQGIQRHILIIIFYITDDLHNTLFPALGDMLFRGKLIRSGGKSGNGSLDDIFVHAHAPVQSLVAHHCHISRCPGTGALGNSVFLVHRQLIADTEESLDGITDSVETSVPTGFYHTPLTILLYDHLRLNSFFLPEMALRDIKYSSGADVILLKDLINLGGVQFLMTSVGHALHQIPHFLPHGGGQGKSELLLKHKCHAALARHAVDADYIRLIFSSHVRRVNGQIRHIPAASALPLIMPCHALADSVLVGAGKCGEHQISRVGNPLMHPHARKALIFLPDPHDVREIQPAVHTVAHHIQSNRHQIHVSRAFPVAEQGALHPVCPCQNPEFRVADPAASVVVGMHTEHHAVPVFQMPVHIFHLAGKHMGHRHLHRGRQVDDRLVFRIRLPYVQHRIADLQRVLRLCLRETLRAVLKGEVPLRLLCDLFQEHRTVHRQLFDGILVFLEYLLPLFHGSGIIEMHHGMRCAFHRLEGLADDMFSGLGEHLDRHVVRNHIALDQRADKIVLCV